MNTPEWIQRAAEQIMRAVVEQPDFLGRAELADIISRHAPRESVNQETESSILLNCPFCGSVARHERHASGNPAVICTNGDCAAMLLDLTTDKATRCWNRRTPTAIAAAERIIALASLEAEAIEALREVVNDGLKTNSQEWLRKARAVLAKYEAMQPPIASAPKSPSSGVANP